MDPRQPLLEVQDLSRTFRLSRSFGGWARREPAAVLRAVAGVSFQVQSGETLGLVGESGCGKTTLGRMVAGLDRPTSGRLILEGREVGRADAGAARDVFQTVQMVFQDPFSSLDPRQTVEQIVREPLDIHHLGTRSQRRRRMQELIDQVALPRRYARSLPHELSGGLRQRVGIASALALRPKLIVADEPTSALDASVQAEIINLLSDLQRNTGVALLFISHNLDVVRFLSHRVAVMYLGRIVEIGTADRVYADPQHPYTRALLSAVPAPDPTVPLRPAELRGEVPSPIDLPAGCPFHPRCWLAEDECRRRLPPLYEFDSSHRASCHVTAAARGVNGARVGEPVDEDLSRAHG